MLAGKVVLITGGCGDIGKAIALVLARHGARVVLNDILEDSAAAPVLKGISDSGGEAHYIRADITDRGRVRGMLRDTLARFGQLDICIANAAIVQLSAFLDLKEDVWQKQLDVNLHGCFHVCQEAARAMVDHKLAGKLILTSSWVQDVPRKNLTAYCVAKSGLKMLAQCMALELAPFKITVNLVAPGNVDAGLSGRLIAENPELKDIVTREIPMGYLMSARQVAEGVFFLCSPAADYMTGSTLLIDGGLSLFLRD